MPPKGLTAAERRRTLDAFLPPDDDAVCQHDTPARDYGNGWNPASEYRTAADLGLAAKAIRQKWGVSREKQKRLMLFCRDVVQHPDSHDPAFVLKAKVLVDLLTVKAGA